MTVKHGCLGKTQQWTAVQNTEEELNVLYDVIGRDSRNIELLNNSMSTSAGHRVYLFSQV